MNANLLRRVNWLWKHRHTHDDDDFQEQITLLKTTVEEQAGTVAGASTGAFIHLHRDSTQSVAVGGEEVEFTAESSVLPRFEFAAPDFPVTSVTIPKAGYYNVEVGLEWDTHTAGGTVWVTRTRGGAETTVWPVASLDDVFWTSTYGAEFTGVAPAVSFKAGDVVKVYVDHDAASAQDLAHAFVAVYLVDRSKLVVSDTYRETVLADGPVAYWRLDEPEGTSTATDETGNGHDGSYEGGVDQGVDGLIANDPDRAAEFVNSSGAAVSIPIHADLKFLNADYSLELWFKQTANTGGTNDRLLCWDADYWSIFIESNGVDDLSIFTARDEVNKGQVDGLASVGATHHVVVTYNATSNDVKLYVDGSLRDTKSSSTTLTDSANDIHIGRERGVASTVPDAAIDEVAIYDKVLAADRVAEHYAIGSGT